MTDNPSTDSAEYVLGTLDPRERAAFAQRLAADPVLQREVAALSRRFVALLDPLEPVMPSPEVWRTIQDRVNTRPIPQLPDDQNVIGFRRPAAVRRVAVVTFAAAAVLILFIATRDAIRSLGPSATNDIRSASATAPASGPANSPASGASGGAAPSPPPGEGHVDIASAPPNPTMEPSSSLSQRAPAEGSKSVMGSVSTAGAVPGLGHISTANEEQEAGTSRGSPLTSTDPDSISKPAAGVATADASASAASYVAVLMGERNTPALTVHIDPATRLLIIGPIEAKIPGGHSLRLWYSRDGQPFRPIGTVSGAPARLAMPAEMTAEGTVIGASLDSSNDRTVGPAAPITYRGKVVRE